MLESATAWFVDDVLVWEGVELGDYIVAFFASDEETTEWSWVTDAESGFVVSTSV